MTKWGQFEVDRDIDFLGVFNKTTQKLYGDSYYLGNDFSQRFVTDIYQGSLGEVWNEMFKSLSERLNRYIENNYEPLKSFSTKYIDDYIEMNDEQIHKIAEQNYIYGDEIEKKKFVLSDYDYRNNRTKILLDYIENPDTTKDDLFDKYINNIEKNRGIYPYDSPKRDNKLYMKESIGLDLLENEYRQKIFDEVSQNPNREIKKKHDIVHALKELNAQSVTLTINHNGKRLDFKYPEYCLNTFNLTFYRVPNTKEREKLQEIYTDSYKYSDFYLEDIEKITYKGKVIYQDDELLEKSKENDINEQPVEELEDELEM